MEPQRGSHEWHCEHKQKGWRTDVITMSFHFTTRWSWRGTGSFTHKQAAECSFKEILSLTFRLWLTCLPAYFMGFFFVIIFSIPICLLTMWRKGRQVIQMPPFVLWSLGYLLLLCLSRDGPVFCCRALVKLGLQALCPHLCIYSFGSF